MRCGKTHHLYLLAGLQRIKKLYCIAMTKARFLSVRGRESISGSTSARVMVNSFASNRLYSALLRLLLRLLAAAYWQHAKAVHLKGVAINAIVEANVEGVVGIEVAFGG